jgi:Tol biopolymer transport system component
LTRGCPWLYSDPAFSSAGNRIAFVRAHEPFPGPPHGAGIYVMDADGSRIRRITTSRTDQEPVISPNGRWILFDRYLSRSGRSQLFLASIRGGRVRQLTHGPGGADATFSANGREVAFVGPRSSIFVMRLDGSDRRRLTRSAPRLDGWYADPDFSPNGRLLALVCGEGDGFGSIARICVMRTDGTHLEHLTRAPLLFAEDPAFSPDGRRIAFLAQLACRTRSCGNNVFLYTMQTDGSHLRRVFNLGSNQQLGSLGVSWQPLFG